jgi:hypothetical protein
MNNLHHLIEKEFAKWALPDELWEAQDVKDFAYTVIKEAIQTTIGICRMQLSHDYVLGGSPTESDVANAKIREEVLKYFDIEERDIDEIFYTNAQFRAHFKCPRKDDPI